MTDRAKLYVQGHLAAAHAGESAFRAAAHRYRETPWGEELARLRDDVAEDRRRLEEIASRVGADLGSPLHRVSQAGLSLLGGATRMLHPRGRLGGVSEIEKLRVAVAGKVAGWDVQLVVSANDDRVPRAEIEELLDRGHDQLARLRSLHLEMARAAFETAGV